MKKLLVFILSAVLLLSVAAGCSKSSSGSDAERTLRIASAYDTDSLYPYKENPTRADGIIGSLIYDSLIMAGEEAGDIKMMLAESYEYTDDNTAVVFHLKKGVKFQNGSEMTASDVVFSYNKFCEENYTHGLVSVSGCEFVDDYTVKFNLDYVYAPLIPGVIHTLFIISEDYYNEVGSSEAYGEKPIGTGAYKLAEWEMNSKLTFEAFDDCYMGEPAIKNAEVIIMTDASARANAIEVGDVDFTLISPTSVELLSGNDSIVLDEYNGTFTAGPIFNLSREEYANVLVRQAISYAIDRQHMVDVEYTGGLGASPTSIIIPKKALGYSEDTVTYEYDIDKAKELMAEAGYADGFDGGTIICNSKGVTASQVLQAALGEIGITVEIQTLESATFYDSLFNMDYDVAMLMMGLEYDDAAATGPFFVTGGDLNFTGYSNPQVDELYAAAESETDQEKRKELYKQVADIIQVELPKINCFSTNDIYAYSTDLANVELTAYSISPYGLSWK